MFVAPSRIRWVLYIFIFVLYAAIFGFGVSSLKLRFFGPCYTRGRIGKKSVSITFDDGPDAFSTPAVLEVLKRRVVPAAFFVVGRRVEEFPYLAARIIDEGHVIGNHSYNHFWWNNFLAGRSLDAELNSAQSAIYRATGRWPIYYRPPVGLSNPHLHRGLKRARLIIVGWDVRSFDRKADLEKVKTRVFKRVRDGSIIVLHDGGVPPERAARLLDELITGLRERGYHLECLEKLLGIDAYHADPPSNTLTLDTGKTKRPILGMALRPLADRIRGTRFGKKALLEKADLADLKFPPSMRTVIGIVVITLSMLLGWPTVGGVCIAAVWLQDPLFFLIGPISYAISWLIWLLGIYLVGPESIEQGSILLRWVVRKVVENFSTIQD